MLKSNSKHLKEDQKFFTMSFGQFASGFVEEDKYDIDGGQYLQEDGRTSLHLAVINNDQAMVNNLLKEGASPNRPDKQQQTPLGLAIRENYTDITTLILKSPSRIKFKSPEISRTLLLAIEKLNIGLTEELLGHGCDPNLARDPKTGENCLHMLMYKLASSVDQDRINFTSEPKKRPEEHAESLTPTRRNKFGKQESGNAEKPSPGLNNDSEHRGKEESQSGENLPENLTEEDTNNPKAEPLNVSVSN